MKQVKLNRQLLMEKLYQYDFNKELELSYEVTNIDLLESDIYHDILVHLDDIDKTIENHLFNYTLKRLSLVDKAILRIAVYEMLFTQMPINIIINEAIELTKSYSDLDDGRQHKFNNRILDNIAKNVRS